MGEVGFELIFLPPYSLEVNPAERIFEEVRRLIEGRVYLSLRAKQAAIEHLLRQFRADKVRLKRLIDWDWIRQTHEQFLDA